MILSCQVPPSESCDRINVDMFSRVFFFLLEKKHLISNIILIQSIYLNKVDNKKDHHIYKINFIPMLMNQAVWMDSRDKGGEN